MRKDAIFVFKIPKNQVKNLNISLNHADGLMIQKNTLFKHSIRLKEDGMDNLLDYLVEIIEN